MEKAVKYSEAEGVEHISASALKRALKEEGLGLKIDETSLAAAQEPRIIVSRRKAIGGTSPQALQKDFLSASGQLKILQRWLKEKRKGQFMAKTHLAEMERNL
jgi:hypothetical protein